MFQWNCRICAKTGTGQPPLICPDPDCESDQIRLDLDERSIPLILNSFRQLRERAEELAEASGFYPDRIDFEDASSMDDLFGVKWEERYCGCCSGETHWEYIPISFLLGTDQEAQAHAEQIKKDRLERERREKEAAAERNRKFQESRERAMLRDLTAKYGGAA